MMIKEMEKLQKEIEKSEKTNEWLNELAEKIRLTKKEYDALISDIDFFIKYVVDKVFDSHDYYFDD